MQRGQTQFKWKIMSLVGAVEISPGPSYKNQYAMALWLYEQGKKVDTKHNTVQETYGEQGDESHGAPSTILSRMIFQVLTEKKDRFMGHWVSLR